MTGKFPEALQLYQTALQASAGDKLEAAKLHSNLSATCAQLGDYEAAAFHATEVIHLQPAWDKGYLRRSHALSCLQQYADAQKTLEQGIYRAKDTTNLSKAQQFLQDLQKTLQRKKARAAVQQSATPLGAALQSLQAAGAFPIVSRKLTSCCMR